MDSGVNGRSLPVELEKSFLGQRDSSCKDPVAERACAWETVPLAPLSPIHTYHRLCLSPEPSLVCMLVIFLSKVITSLMEHAWRSFLPALTVSEGLTHGHLIPRFWTHCETEYVMEGFFIAGG